MGKFFLLFPGLCFGRQRHHLKSATSDHLELLGHETARPKNCRPGCANPGRQSAKIKERGRFQVSIKNLNPPEGRIEDCTLLSWSSIPKPRCLDEGLRYYATGRSSDFRIILAPTPSPPKTGKWHFAGVVPGYSGGTVTDSHRLPFYPDGTCIALSITSCRFLSSKGLQVGLKL